MKVKRVICLDCSDALTSVTREIFNDQYVTASQADLINKISIRLIESFFNTFTERDYIDLIEEISEDFRSDSALHKKINRIDDYIGVMSVALHRLFYLYKIRMNLYTGGSVKCVGGRVQATLISLND